MISARQKNTPSRKIPIRFSAIARSVMISACGLRDAPRRHACFSAIARSVMISAELRDALRAFERVSVL